MSRMRSRSVLVALLLPLLAAAAGGCRTNVATGRSQFDLYDRTEEIAIGEEAMPQLVADYGGQLDAPALSGYVREVGMRLASVVEDPEKRSLPWEFTVLDSDVINAFALPGGKVFISRGLLAQMESEAELAAVLGHEVGHVTAEHAEQRIASATGVQIGAAIAGTAASIFGGGSGAAIAQATNVLVGTAGQGFLLKFSRDQESESDALGVRYMVLAGYDPDGMIQLLSILKSASEGGRNLEILSTHPYPETRLGAMETLLETSYPGQRNNPNLRMGVSEWQMRAAPSLAGGSASRARLPLGATCWCGGDHADEGPLALALPRSEPDAPPPPPLRLPSAPRTAPSW